MKNDGFIIVRDWVEQARLLFKRRGTLANVMLILIEYALYNREYEGKDDRVRAFLMSVSKSISKQRLRYEQTEKARNSQLNPKDKDKDKDKYKDKDTSREEEYKKRLIERIKNNS